MRPWSFVSRPRGNRAAISGAAVLAHRWGSEHAGRCQLVRRELQEGESTPAAIKGSR